MSLFNYLRRKAGKQSTVTAKPEYIAEISIYILSKKIYKSRSTVRANSKKEALMKVEKAVAGDLCFKVKIKPPKK